MDDGRPQAMRVPRQAQLAKAPKPVGRAVPTELRATGTNGFNLQLKKQDDALDKGFERY